MNTNLDPFPSAPSRPARYSITAMTLLPGDPFKRVYAVSFHDAYGAKRWLDLMIGNNTVVRRGYELTIDGSNITLRCFELDELLSYEYKASEERYMLPEADVRMIARFRRGEWFPRTEEDIVPDIVKQAKVKTTVTTTKITMPDGFVKVTDLCKGTSVKPMDARAILRSLMPKPDYGWAFAPTRLPEIRKLIGV